MTLLYFAQFGANIVLFVAWRPWALGTLRLRPCPCFHVACPLLSAEMTVVTTFDVSLKEGMVHCLLSLLHQLSEFVLMIWEHVHSLSV